LGESILDKGASQRAIELPRQWRHLQMYGIVQDSEVYDREVGPAKRWRSHQDERIMAPSAGAATTRRASDARALCTFINLTTVRLR